MFPYLRLIAYENNISDPLDRRVVEAYWIGNELLENVSMKQLYRWLLEEQGLKKKFTRRDLELVVGKIPQGAKVHHSFHVFNIFRHARWSGAVRVLETMNNCMISWGKIKAKESNTIKVYSDATLVFPLIVAEAFQTP